MFFIYSTKPIVLATVPLTSPCPTCQHEWRYLTIYKKYFRFFFIPLVPLRKKAVVACPGCGHEQSKRKFIKTREESERQNIALHLQKLIKQTKAPKYPLIILSCLLVAIGGLMFFGFLENREQSKKIHAFMESPHENVALLAKIKDEEYPYQVFLLSKIEDQLVAWQWKYAYQAFTPAHTALKSLNQKLSAIFLEEHFLDPIPVDKDDLQQLDIVHLESISIHNPINTK